MSRRVAQPSQPSLDEIAIGPNRQNYLAEHGGGNARLPHGIAVEVRLSGWKGINGKIGYGSEVIPGAGIVERLGVTELQSKVGETGLHQTAHHAARSAEAGGAKSQTSQADGKK